METTMMMNFPTLRENITVTDEVNLMVAAQMGDLEAFNQIVILYQDRIFYLTLRILGDEDSAEDITQSTFLKAYRTLPSFRKGSFRYWLYRIATNACYDELRRRIKHPILPLEYEDGEDVRPLPYYELPGANIMPEKEYERRELERVIQQALDQLDPDQRAVVVLVDLQGFDYSEAAQVLGIPVGTVKSRLARARLRLRNLLQNTVTN